MYLGGLEDYQGRVDLQVFDMSARLIVERTNFSPYDYVSLPNMSSGIYIVRVFYPPPLNFKPVVIKQFILNQ